MDKAKLKHILVGGLIAYEEDSEEELSYEDAIEKLDDLIDSREIK